MSDFGQPTGPASSKIELTAEEKKVFGQLFAQADTQSIGVITGELAVKFFEKSGLNPQTLGEIWGIADTENRGLLTKLGFSIALRLIGQAQAGNPPRAELAYRPGPIPTFAGAIGAFPGSSPPLPQQPTPIPQAQPTQQTPTSPLQQQLSGNAVLVPRLTPEDVARFTDLFEKSGAVDGVIPGERAREIFQKAKLPNTTLGVIWSLSDRQQRGALGAGEFVVAMHLIQCTMRGTLPTLPTILPPALFEAASGRAAGPRPVDGRQRPPPGANVSRQVTGQMPMVPIAKQFSGSGINLQRAQSPLRRQFTPPPIPPPPAQSASEVPWAVNPQDKAKFDAHFTDVDAGNKGFITGEEAVPFFSGSKLPEEALAQIWDLADIHKNGTLTREEFAIAMHLIRTERTNGTNGKGLPETLPLSYIPPAMRQQLGYGSPQAPQSSASSSAFDPPPQALPPPPKKSTYNDDLFGLEDSFSNSPSSAPTPSTAAPPQSALGFTTFPSSNDLFGNTAKSPLNSPPSQFGSNIKPFQPLSGFGQSILQPTVTGSSNTSQPFNRGASPAQSHQDDLLGDNDPEVSRKLTNESTELANLSNQIGSLTKQTQDLKLKRTSAEQNLSNVSNQKHEIELKLASLRQMYQKEEREVKQVEEKLQLTRNETNRLQNDYALIEASLIDLRTSKAEVSTAYQNDQQENLALKEKMKVVNAEINGLRPELEKLKDDVRRQKGLVTISKKQLSTAESERDKIKADMETERKDLLANQELLRKTSSPGPPASPTLSQASAASNNPFSNPFNRTRSPPATQENAFSASPFAPSAPAGQSAFENVFGSSFTPGNSTPAPPTSFARQDTGSKEIQHVPQSASSVSDGGAFGGASTPPTSPPTSNYSHQTEAPPPAIANQMTSAFLPLPLNRSESTTSSIQVQPSDAGFSRSDTPSAWGDSIAEATIHERDPVGPSPLASSFGGSEVDRPRQIERTPTGSTAGGGNTDRAFSSAFGGPTTSAVPGTFPGMDVITPMNPIKPTATGDSYMSATSMRSRSSSKPEFARGMPDPFSFSKDESRAATKSKDDFDAAFADFGPPKTQERQLTGTASAKPNQEFPPIVENFSDDSSDEASHTGGFEDDFAPGSPERLRAANTGEGAAALMTPVGSVPHGPGTPLPSISAQASPPAYQANLPGSSVETNPFPQEFTNLLAQRGDPTIKSRTLSGSSGDNVPRFMASPVGTPGPVKTTAVDNDVFASAVSDPARDVFNPIAAPAPIQYAAPVAHSPSTDFGAFKSQTSVKPSDEEFDDDDFVNLSDAKEGDTLDEFRHNDFDEFNPVFDSPGPSKPSTAMSNTTTTHADDDFDPFHQNTGGNSRPFASTGATSSGFMQKPVTDWDALFAGSDDKKADQPSVPSKEPLSPSGQSPTVSHDFQSTNTHEKLTKLQNMGFPEEKATQALEKFGNNLPEATNYLLDSSAQR